MIADHHATKVRDDHGATAVEYALMVGLIAIVIIAGVTAFGLSVNDLFDVPFPG